MKWKRTKKEDILVNRIKQKREILKFKKKYSILRRNLKFFTWGSSITRVSNEYQSNFLKFWVIFKVIWNSRPMKKMK